VEFASQAVNEVKTSRARPPGISDWRSHAGPIDWTRVSSRFKQPEDNNGYLFWQLAHGWMRSLNRALLSTELTHLQFSVLGSTAWLSQAARPPSQIRIAEFCAMDPMLISKTIRMLERKKLVRRHGDLRDTRIKLVSMTRKGEQTLLRVIPLVERAYADFFAPLGEQEPVVHQALLTLFRGMKVNRTC
jgi:MarR family transcriptional regulator, organic hydroperoxide resistance regulator